MCQYSSRDGFVNDWHLVHLGSRAVGGAGLVMTEATAVVPEGRISPQDLGIWSDAHIEGLAALVRVIDAAGAVAGIQLAHAGRKASMPAPWDGEAPVPPEAGGWRPLAPSAEPFSATSPMPQALEPSELPAIVRAFADAAGRALAAGFRVVEIHAAHGYLLHEFLSPLANRRTDAYGGSFANRTRLLREVAAAVRGVCPDHVPLFVRISATDWVEGGWSIDESVALAVELRNCGVDLIDVSSGGMVPSAQIPTAPLYQVPFAERIRREASIATGAVGLITEPHEAEEIVAQERADLVLIGRASLRDPMWPLHAAQRLGVEVAWPRQYERAQPRLAPR